MESGPIPLAVNDVNGCEGQQRTRPRQSFGTASALLLADGDRLGRLVGELGGEAVGTALSSFTADVPGIVVNHGGVTVYAGGDDVLAMLPVEGALDCARELADSYRTSFAGEAGATLSAAVVFAQARVPLGNVIAEAHRLLDEVAKEGNGRNSVAMGVLKGSGRHCQWVSSWTRRFPDASEAPAMGAFTELMQQMGALSTEPGVSGSLVYRFRDTVARLSGMERWKPGDGCQGRRQYVPLRRRNVVPPG